MTPSDDAPAFPETQSRTTTRAARSRGAMRHCWLLAGGMIAATGLGLSACVPSLPPEPAPPPAAAPAPAPAPTPAPTPTPTPPPAVKSPTNWLDQPLTEGTWHYMTGPRANRALFISGTSGVRFTVACEPANRQVKLWFPAVIPGPTAMAITTTEAHRSLAALPAPAPLTQAVATLQPYDPILDAIIFTRGRFAVQVPGMETLYLPSWPEIARVVEDCR